MTDLPPPTGEPWYYITPEEGGASDIEAMWLAEEEMIAGVSELNSPPHSVVDTAPVAEPPRNDNTNTHTTKESP